MLNILIQNAQEGAEVITDGESVEKTLSIIELISSGGFAGQVIIAVLFLLLVGAIYIYFERIFAIKAASQVDANFMNQIKDHVSNGKIDSAQMLCAQQNSPVSRLIGKGISRIGKPLADINTAIETAGKLEVYQLEKNVSVLATISSPPSACEVVESPSLPEVSGVTSISIEPAPFVMVMASSPVMVAKTGSVVPSPMGI